MSSTHNSGYIPIKTLLPLIAGGTFLGMTIYESVKDIIFPQITKWQSHLITIAVSVILVTFLTYILLQKQNTLQRQIFLTRQNAESALKHLASIVESSDDAIVSMTQDGKIISWNPGAERMFGVSADEMIHQTYDLLLPANMPSRIPDLIKQAGLRRSTRHADGVFIKKDGTHIHLSLTITPIFNTQEYSGMISLIARDISEQMKREEMLKMLNLKQQLLSSVTRHDINNRLHILLGYCSLLEEKISDPEISRLISVIEEQSNRINQQVLFMKEYESLGIKTPAWDRADEIFSRATTSFSKDPIVFEISLDHLEIYADPLIEKAIYNICENAIRYGKKITSIHTSFSYDEDICTWIIEDDGIGVKEEFKEKIFERGFGQNTGLGLFLVREILAITNIQITETGNAGRGARFEMIIPSGSWRIGKH